jgi:hypothetical protein
MTVIFMEVIVNAAEASALGIDSRDEIEDALDDALAASGEGEVTGGGGGMGHYIIDIEAPEDRFGKALMLIRVVLRALNVPASSKIRRAYPDKREYTVYE